jgi:hypothetical protein
LNDQAPQPPQEPEGASLRSMDYAHITSPSKKLPSIIGGLIAGCAYSVVAIFLSYQLCNQVNLTMAGSHTLPDWWIIVPSLALAIPFILGLFFRGWRSFAMGILIPIGLGLLIVGACAGPVWPGLGH